MKRQYPGLCEKLLAKADDDIGRVSPSSVGWVSLCVRIY